MLDLTPDFCKNCKFLNGWDELEEQRDELLAACKGLMKECDNGSARFDDPAPDSIFIKANQAIERAEK